MNNLHNFFRLPLFVFRNNAYLCSKLQEIMDNKKPIDANDLFILQGKVTSIHRDTRKY